jgi:hypothetical protein
VSAHIFARLDGTDDVLALNLSEAEWLGLEARDDELAAARRARDAERASPGCGGGDTTFHIDALGRLQRCSRNRRGWYDLRMGSFAEGFDAAMPRFPCPRRVPPDPGAGDV